MNYNFTSNTSSMPALNTPQILKQALNMQPINIPEPHSGNQQPQFQQIKTNPLLQSQPQVQPQSINLIQPQSQQIQPQQGTKQPQSINLIQPQSINLIQPQSQQIQPQQVTKQPDYKKTCEVLSKRIAKLREDLFKMLITYNEMNITLKSIGCGKAEIDINNYFPAKGLAKDQEYNKKYITFTNDKTNIVICMSLINKPIVCMVPNIKDASNLIYHAECSGLKYKEIILGLKSQQLINDNFEINNLESCKEYIINVISNIGAKPNIKSIDSFAKQAEIPQNVLNPFNVQPQQIKTNSPLQPQVNLTQPQIKTNSPLQPQVNLIQPQVQQIKTNSPLQAQPQVQQIKTNSPLQMFNIPKPQVQQIKTNSPLQPQPQIQQIKTNSPLQVQPIDLIQAQPQVQQIKTNSPLQVQPIDLIQPQPQVQQIKTNSPLQVQQIDLIQPQPQVQIQPIDIISF